MATDSPVRLSTLQFINQVSDLGQARHEVLDLPFKHLTETTAT